MTIPHPRGVMVAVLIICLCLTLPRIASGQESSGVRADPDSTSVAELIALEHHLNGLLQSRDWEAYGAYVAEDYRQTNRRGEIRSKAQVLAELRNPRPAGRQVETMPDSITVRVYGETAVLQAVLVGRYADNGETSFRSRIMKVFIRRGGKWYMVAMQGTPLS